MSRAIEKIRGRTLSLNVDGALGVLTAELTFPNELAMNCFILARESGLCAHFIEELKNMRMRSMIVEYKYTGPEEK